MEMFKEKAYSDLYTLKQDITFRLVETINKLTEFYLYRDFQHYFFWKSSFFALFNEVYPFLKNKELIDELMKYFYQQDDFEGEAEKGINLWYDFLKELKERGIIDISKKQITAENAWKV
ncbi:MAG TPA: hypothetical protein EYH56_02140 [Nanoarchaeota archaeon]|nr:hypothetical protein [Nanoarchaeota archaeon]